MLVSWIILHLSVSVYLSWHILLLLGLQEKNLWCWFYHFRNPSRLTFVSKLQYMMIIRNVCWLIFFFVFWFVFFLITQTQTINLFQAYPPFIITIIYVFLFFYIPGTNAINYYRKRSYQWLCSKLCSCYWVDSSIPQLFVVFTTHFRVPIVICWIQAMSNSL